MRSAKCRVHGDNFHLQYRIFLQEVCVFLIADDKRHLCPCSSGSGRVRNCYPHTCTHARVCVRAHRPSLLSYAKNSIRIIIQHPRNLMTSRHFIKKKNKPFHGHFILLNLKDPNWWELGEGGIAQSKCISQ